MTGDVTIEGALEEFKNVTLLDLAAFANTINSLAGNDFGVDANKCISGAQDRLGFSVSSYQASNIQDAQDHLKGVGVWLERALKAYNESQNQSDDLAE